MSSLEDENSEESSDGESQCGGDKSAMIKKLKSEVEVLKKKNHWLKEKLKEANDKQSRGRLRRKRFKYSEDEHNSLLITAHINQKLGRKFKLLPNGWHKYSENPTSFCQMLMKGLAIPKGIGEQRYWEDSVCYIVNDRFSTKKGNTQTKIKEQFMRDMERGAPPVIVNKYLVEYLLDKFPTRDYEYSHYNGYYHFMANYVVHTMGKKNLKDAMKANKNSTLFDHLTVSDEAWTITMLANNQECWEHEFNSRKKHPTAPTAEDDAVAENEEAAPKPKWTHMRKGEKCQLFQSSWSEDGKQYYAEVYKAIKKERMMTGMKDIIQSVHEDFMKTTCMYSNKAEAKDDIANGDNQVEEYLNRGEDEIKLLNDEGGYDSDAAIDVIVAI